MGWGNESTLVQLKRDAARARRLEAERDAAIAERDAAQAECAEMHDALDSARMVIDEAQAKARQRRQAEAWAHAAVAVERATGAPITAKVTYGCGCVQHPSAPPGQYVSRCAVHRATGTAVTA